jgi:hypothetical protein
MKDKNDDIRKWLREAAWEYIRLHKHTLAARVLIIVYGEPPERL